MTLTAVQAGTLIILGTPFTLWWGANGTLVAVLITMVTAFVLGMWYVFHKVALSAREVFGGRGGDGGSNAGVGAGWHVVRLG